jgi:glyoxylase-like metal-dependent hydrolase (beta-lactamase superfamily II)
MLIEAGNELVLVDTGYGLGDVYGKPRRRLSHLWPAVLNVALREEHTAIRQIERLGFSATDVRHIVLTHLDFDHAGGLSDFPSAQVHLLAREREAAFDPRRSFVGNQRYRPLQWARTVNWHLYEPDGEPWFGFESVRHLDGLPPEILMVPLPGHTLGHAGVAVRGESGWLFNAGDAYLSHGELDLRRPHMPPGLAVYEKIMATDAKAAKASINRLRDLRDRHRDVTVFCSHDTNEFKALVEGRPLGPASTVRS